MSAGPALCAILCAGLLTGDLLAQDAPAAPATTQAAAPPAWEYSASAYTYLVPEDDNYVQPTFTADHEWLHLEARYNYEDRYTFSAWVGYNFSMGEKVTVDITPMLGGVIGDTSGIAPGYEFSLNWRWLDVYTEGEYVFSTEGESGSYFYSWSTVTVSPVTWLQLGMVTQHTRAYETDRDIQRGILVGYSGEQFSIVAHMFNPDDDKPTYILAFIFSW